MNNKMENNQLIVKKEQDKSLMQLQKRTEMELLSISPPTTIQLAVQAWVDNQSLTISKIIQDDGAKKFLVNSVTTQLQAWLSLLSTTGNMDSKTTYRIVQEFFKNNLVKNLNIHELKFFLSECTSMKYGKVYHGFGFDVLMDWFEKYWDIREREFETQRENQRMELTAHEKARRSGPFKLQSVSGKATEGELPDYNSVGEILNNLKDKK